MSDKVEAIRARYSKTHHLPTLLEGRRDVTTLLAALDDARDEVSKMEFAAGLTVDERDHRCRQLEEVAESLGLQVEWSSACDVGDEAIEGAQAAVQRYENSEAKLQEVVNSGEITVNLGTAIDRADKAEALDVLERTNRVMSLMDLIYAEAVVLAKNEEHEVEIEALDQSDVKGGG